jgi:CRP-like cAMP-binding protein
MLVHYLKDGRESMLQMICPGSPFSTSSVVVGSPYSTSAWILESCSYACMKREDLLWLMKKIPFFGTADGTDGGV